MSYRTESDIALSTTSKDGDIIPLTGISVEGTLAGPFLSVTMKQRWTNFTSVPLEALWHFPLPAGAVVRSLVVERKGKKQVAKVEPRDKAFETYDKAIDEGSRASILDAITEGVLSLRLGNLDARDSMLVEVSWVQIVEETAGSLRVRIPTSIAPRYFPANWEDKSPVPREELLSLPWESEVPYGISVVINIEEPDSVGAITSPSHQMTITMTEQRMIAQVGSDFSAMDRDFVLDVKAKAEGPNMAWMESWKDTTWIAADIQLPKSQERKPRSIAFLIDVSGSMTGESLDAAKTAMKAALGVLGKTDHFGVFAFSDSVIDGQSEALGTTQENVIDARTWIDRLETIGGTELAGALNHVWKKGRWTDVLVLTDGEIGDEALIALAAKTQLKIGTRLHILGIGSAPATDVIAHIARAGGGISANVHPNDRIEPKVLSVVSSIFKGFADRLLLTVSGQICDVAAPTSGALGSRIRILAKAHSSIPVSSTVSLIGRVGAVKIQIEAPVSNFNHTGEDQGVLAALWAQARISYQSDIVATLKQGSKKAKEITAELEKVALTADILSSVTSLVLVDESGEKVEGPIQFLNVPVAIPHGYDICSFVSERIVGKETLLFEASSTFSFDDNIESFDRISQDKNLCWWDILTLQIPGGGFGPLESVLELLGIEKEEMSLEDYKGEYSSKILATALCLQWLEQNCPQEVTVWEPMVGESRNLLADMQRSDPDLHAKAIEVAGRILMINME